MTDVKHIVVQLDGEEIERVLASMGLLEAELCRALHLAGAALTAMGADAEAALQDMLDNKDDEDKPQG